MKNTRILVISAFTVLMLSVSQFNPLVSTIGLPADQSTTFETGDHLEFDLSRDESRTDYRQSTSFNASDPSQIFNYQEEGYDEYLSLGGQVSVDILRQRSYLPVIDTVVIPKVSSETLSGSQRSGYRNELFRDFNNTLTWQNETFPVEDLSGMFFGDEGEPEDIESNGTYSLIFDEMLNSSVYVDFYGFPGIDTSNFSRMADLTYRDVYNDVNWLYNINGVDQLFNVRVVDSEFSTIFTETTIVVIPIGPEDDPNTQWVDAQVTWSIQYDEYYSHIFDQATGAPLEIREGNNFIFDFTFGNINITVTDPTGNYTFNFGIESSFGLSAWSDQVMTLTHSSSLFGNTRPTSVGTGRLMEGDVLEYWADSYESINTDFEITVNDYNGTFRTYETEHYENSFEGTMILDVFRHNNNQFDAVIFMEGYSNSSNWFSIEEYENGYQVFYDSGNYFDGPNQQIYIDILHAGSTTTQEFVPGFEPSLRFPDFFNNDCRDGGCDGDDFVPPMPHEIPALGPINHTLLDFTVFDSEDLPSLEINGFNYTWSELDYWSQEYFLNWTSIIQVPIGEPEDGEDRMWMNATMEITAWGNQQDFYDPATGALIAHGEYLEINLWIGGSASFFDDVTNTTIWIDIYVNLWYDSDFSFYLKSHPNLYLTAQTTATTSTPVTTTTTTSTPVTTTTTTSTLVTTTTTTSTLVTTTTTTSTPVTTSSPVTTTTATSTTVDTNTSTPADTTSTTPSNSSTEPTTEDTAPGLPVPVPIVPVMAAFVVISVFIRKKR